MLEAIATGLARAADATGGAVHADRLGLRADHRHPSRPRRHRRDDAPAAVHLRLRAGRDARPPARRSYRHDLGRLGHQHPVQRAGPGQEPAADLRRLPHDPARRGGAGARRLGHGNPARRRDRRDLPGALHPDRAAADPGPGSGRISDDGALGHDPDRDLLRRLAAERPDRRLRRRADRLHRHGSGDRDAALHLRQHLPARRGRLRDRHDRRVRHRRDDEALSERRLAREPAARMSASAR